MSAASRKILSLHLQRFRLKPLMIAMALMSPLGTLQAQQIQSSPNSQQIQYSSHRFHQDHVLGTSLDVVVTGTNAQQAQLALNSIQNEISRLDAILSTWKDQTEIGQLNQTKKIQASPELFEVVAACENWRSQTCGAFDARLGQLLSLWENSQHVKPVETEQQRQALVSQLQSAKIQLDPQQQTIQIEGNIKIAPDAYAKGYIIDRALAAARQQVPEMQGLMIDIGGDIRVWGQAPQGDAWHIGVQSTEHYDNAAPQQTLKLNQQAIAFSGQGYRDLSGQTHLLNPKTGQPAQQVEHCVVVGKCAADADALATALAAMPANEGLKLVEQLAGYDAKVVLSNGKTQQTTGWNSLVAMPEDVHLQPIAGNAASSWPAGYQAVIDLTIPRLNVENYRVPYVSVWITDSDKKLVRTLAVWGKDQKWINSNYVWWRRYGRQMPNLDAVAKPSRQPGQYKLAWDGKDDHGKLVAAGNYIMHIETTREHGGHSYQSMNFEVKPKASSQSLPAQAEVGAVKLNFQRFN